MSEDYGPFGNEAAFLEVFMADRDLPCPVCNYNLKAITSANCPEFIVQRAPP